MSRSPADRHAVAREWASDADVASVAELLGRAPAGRFSVVRRDRFGAPEVMRNEPFLEDGTPMPTRYWLVSAALREAVGRLEAAGGVRQAEAEVDAVALADAHRRYAAQRDALVMAFAEHGLVPGEATAPRPSGGVGGTRRGVKCLHAHLAWYLAGGDDPVGHWVALHLAASSGEGAVAALDCGTNSTRLLVVSSEGIPLERAMRITRLGEGLGTSGRLSEAAIARTLDALGSYRAAMDRYGVVAQRGVATSAARDAANAEELFERAGAVLGQAPELLEGEEEGALAYHGATADLEPEAGPYLMADLGGGSTELVAGAPRRARGDAAPAPLGAVVSLPLGCVRLTEAYFDADPPSASSLAAARRHVDALVREALGAHRSLREPARLVSVAGTSATISALAHGLDHYERSSLHLATVSKAVVAQLADELCAERVAERAERPGIEPGRAEVIAAGALELATVMDALGSDELVHSESDILDGIAMALVVDPGRPR